jgi:hypothetical protein
MNRVSFPKTFLTLAAGAILAACLAACTKTSSSANTPIPESSATQTQPAASPKSGFEADMQYVRNSNFAHVWVFSRKDGKVIDKDDAAYLRTNAPQVVDWVTTQEGKKVIAGTNFDLELGGLNLIRKRFVVEDWTGK